MCSQNRIIQKCLFNKLRENTVKSVSGLSALLDDTYETLTARTSEVVRVQRASRTKRIEFGSIRTTRDVKGHVEMSCHVAAFA